jgi:hypothetical protein
MKNKIEFEDWAGDVAQLSLGINCLRFYTDTQDFVTVDLPQAKKLSKWLKKAIKELEKREAGE